MSAIRNAALLSNASRALLYLTTGTLILVYRSRFPDVGVSLDIMAYASLAYGAFRLYRAYLAYKAPRGIRRAGMPQHREE